MKAYVVRDRSGHEHGTFPSEPVAIECRDECTELYDGTFYVHVEEVMN